MPADNKTQCPFCRSTQLKLVADKVRFDYRADVYDCLDCGLTFLDQGSCVFPPDFYEKAYHQTYLTHVEPDAFDPNLYYEKMKKATRMWADKFRQMLSAKESVLDVGCSTGHFIDLVKDKTSRIYGYELNKKEVAFCREKLGLSVTDNPVGENFSEGSLDYITLIYVLEHIAQPEVFLRDLKKFLKPGGKFVILVPNIQDPLVRFYDIPEFRSFYYCMEHLFYYNAATIKQLFDQSGLQGSIEVLQEYPLSNHLNWSFRRKPSDTLAARKGYPDVQLVEGVALGQWQDLWLEYDKLYREFLKHNGYGDRLWCVVG